MSIASRPIQTGQRIVMRGIRTMRAVLLNGCLTVAALSGVMPANALPENGWFNGKLTNSSEFGSSGEPFGGVILSIDPASHTRRALGAGHCLAKCEDDRNEVFEFPDVGVSA
jgi:hypothetical protein